jgi:hypothetical protein
VARVQNPRGRELEPYKGDDWWPCELVKPKALGYYHAMPTVLRVDGCRVSVLLPPREHGPAHVHVKRGGGKVVVELHTLRIRKIQGDISDADVRRAVRIVEYHMDTLLQEWRKYHGA